MPRQKRADEAGTIYHALNRGNARQVIFHKTEDYDAFLRVLAEGLQRYSAELFAFTLMPNHWHLVLRPGADGQMGLLLRWVTATHTLRYHAHYHTRGEGHLYQSRFKSFPVNDDEHFLVLCRYVERNSLRAGLVDRAEDWVHSSLNFWARPHQHQPDLLSPWPIARLPNWIDRVNNPLTDRELDSIRTCINRGRPLGDKQWVNMIAKKQEIEFTLRPQGRPRKESVRQK